MKVMKHIFYLTQIIKYIVETYIQYEITNEILYIFFIYIYIYIYSLGCIV